MVWHHVQLFSASLTLTLVDGPLGSIFPGRVVDDQIGDETRLIRAEKWIQACGQTHQDCTVQSPPLPTRVIDVGEDRTSGVVRLVENSSATASGRYVALSHCWGRSNLPTTTKENRKQRLESISLQEMSKSFAEAIAVTRFLGLRYIWIDSLCIVQNDFEDWEAEAAKMHLVYSNAFLTVSITGAKDGSVGCFPGLANKKYAKLPYAGKGCMSGDIYATALPPVKEADTDRYIIMGTEPLSDRGWCFQERVLSRRILHFASDQMYFECLNGFLGEDGLRIPTRYLTIHGELGGTRQLARPWTLLFYHLPRAVVRRCGVYGGPGNSRRFRQITRAWWNYSRCSAQKLNDQYISGYLAEVHD